MQADLFKKTAILIEQNPIETVLYSDALSANCFDVLVTSSPMEALVKLRETEIDLVLIDMGDASNAFISKFVQNIRKEKKCEFTVIFGLSIYPFNNEKNMKLNLDACLTKPFSIDTLIDRIFSSIESKCNDCECINSK